MITWESLDPEAQRHWLALAEAKHGMPVTWNDVEPARREGLLETVKRSFARTAGKTRPRKGSRSCWLSCSRTDCIEDDRTGCAAHEKQRNALQIIIDDLEVDCTPEDPDWRALFLPFCASTGRRATSAGTTGVVCLEALQLASDFVVERNKAAAQREGRCTLSGRCSPSSRRGQALDKGAQKGKGEAALR